MLDGTQSRCGRKGGINILLPLPVIEPRFLSRQRVARRFIDWVIPVLRTAIALWNCKAISILAVPPSVVLIVTHMDRIYLEIT